MSDVLARLTAVLDGAVAAAQAVLACEEPYLKLAREEGVTTDIRYQWVQHTQLSTGGSGTQYFSGAPSPRDVLRLVAGMRKLIDIEIVELEHYDREEGHGCTAEDIRAGRCTEDGSLDGSPLLSVLCGIYLDDPAPDPTEVRP